MSLFSSTRGLSRAVVRPNSFLTCPDYFPKAYRRFATFLVRSHCHLFHFTTHTVIEPNRRPNSSDNLPVFSTGPSPVIVVTRAWVTVIEASVIDLPTMTDFYDFDRAFSVVNRVENAVVPLSDAIYIIPK